MSEYPGAFSVLVCVALLVTKLAAIKKLPEYVTPCKNDANLSVCSRQVLENLRPYLVKGIPEFRVPSIDPLRIPKISASRRNSNIARYDGIITDLKWTGGKDFEIIEITIDPNRFMLRLKLGFPHLYLEGYASGIGTVVGFEINGTATIGVNYTNVVADIILNGKLYCHDGKEFIEWENEDVSIVYDNVYFTHIDGFFEDPTITELFRIAINRAARLMQWSFRTALDLSVGKFIVDVINRVHRLFPRNALYPEIS